MVFEKELKRLGLKDKEAAVYISCLGMGPSPVQQISRKSKVVRATTYVVLESLERKGLVTHYKEGKKTLFSAEPPRQLVRLLDKQRDEIDEKRRDLEQLLPELQVIMKASEMHPTVRYFDGIEGLKSIRREMMMCSESGDEWLNFTPVDHLDAVIGKDDDERYFKQRIEKKIRTKTIFSTRSPELKKKLFEQQYRDRYAERRFVSSREFPSASGMTIYKDSVAIGSFTGKIGGVIIESVTMSDMMRRLFGLAWKGLDSEYKKEGVANGKFLGKVLTSAG